jgi:hypothetical protein
MQALSRLIRSRDWSKDIQMIFFSRRTAVPHDAVPEGQSVADPDFDYAAATFSDQTGIPTLLIRSRYRTDKNLLMVRFNQYKDARDAQRTLAGTFVAAAGAALQQPLASLFNLNAAQTSGWILGTAIVTLAGYGVAALHAFSQTLKIKRELEGYSLPEPEKDDSAAAKPARTPAPQTPS